MEISAKTGSLDADVWLEVDGVVRLEAFDVGSRSCGQFRLWARGVRIEVRDLAVYALSGGLHRCHDSNTAGRCSSLPHPLY